MNTGITGTIEPTLCTSKLDKYEAFALAVMA